MKFLVIWSATYDSEWDGDFKSDIETIEAENSGAAANIVYNRVVSENREAQVHVDVFDEQDSWVDGK